MDILAGIVTYNPDIELLRKNINSVLPQVDYLVIVDNHSDNRNEIRKFQDDKIFVIENVSNQGIACALNQEFEFALEKTIKWVLTLDQDTIVPDNLLAEYKLFVNFEDVRMLTCHIQDRNLELQNIQCSGKFEYVSSCITAGSLLSVDAWKQVNGFCEDLFIDAVDHDMCFRLLEHGYKILKVNNVVLNHAVGESKFVFFFGKKYLLYNESPLRIYYQFRNNIYLLKQHKNIVLRYYYKNSYFRFIISRLIRAILICRYEDQSFNKFFMILKGVWHGIIGKYGKYE